MTLEEIRKNLKVFKECALRQVEAAVENWIDEYCEDSDPNFQDINPEIVKYGLLDDEELIEDLAKSIAILIQIKMIND